MQLAILLYAHSSNPTGIPASWPAKAQPIEDGADLPSSEWLRMTEAEFEQYKLDHKAEWDTWNSAQISVDDNVVARKTAGNDLAVELLKSNFKRLNAADRWTFLKRVSVLRQAIGIGDFEAAQVGIAELTSDAITPQPLIDQVNAQLSAMIAKWPVG